MPNEKVGKMNVFVTGATGAVGPVLVEKLLQKSCNVRIFSRTAPSSVLFKGPVKFFQGDVSEPKSVIQALKGADIVYHIAAKLHLNNPSVECQQEYYRVNVRGTQNLVQAARSAGVCRFVFFSTISVYGPSQPGDMLDETSPLQPQSLYASTKSQAEKIVLAANQRDAETPMGTVLRLAAVYGSRMKGNYVRLVKALRRGLFIPIGSGWNRRTLIYDHDVADAAILAGFHPEAAGQVFNVTDGQIYTLREILAAISQALGRRPPRLYLPVKPSQIVIGLMETCLSLLGMTSPIKRSFVDTLVEDVAVKGEKIQRILNFQPRYDLMRGWKKTVQFCSDGA